LLTGAVLGAVGATLLAPGFLTWYNTPGGMGQALCNCPELVRTTAAQLVQAQLTGAGIGAAASLVLGIFFVRARRQRQQAVVAPHPADRAMPPPDMGAGE